MVDHEAHIYYKVTFYPCTEPDQEDTEIEPLGGQGHYLEEHQLKRVPFLANICMMLYRLKKVNVRIEEKRYTETEFNHFERPMEVLHDGI